jgi:hypothetical protein
MIETVDARFADVSPLTEFHADASGHLANAWV